MCVPQSTGSELLDTLSALSDTIAENIPPSLSKTSHFPKLNVRSGCWVIRLADDSLYLTMFNSPLSATISFAFHLVLNQLRMSFNVK